MSAPNVGDSDIAHFDRNGFVALPPLFGKVELRELRSAVDERLNFHMRNPQHPVAGTAQSTILEQAINLWRECPTIRRFAFESRIAAAALRLARASTVRLWHDQGLRKPAHCNNPTPWHQDLPFWPMEEPTALSAWIALDDVDEDSACLQYIPGSHMRGVMPLLGLSSMLISASETARAVPVPLAAGGCVFHHGLTLHGSTPNLRSVPRLALKIVYLPDVVHYRRRSHIVSDQFSLIDGDPLVGDDFPVILKL